MKAIRGYEKETIKRIADNCGSKALRKEISYLDMQWYRNPSKTIIEIIDDIAFFALSEGKNHYRLMFIAVEKESQHKGYGKMMFRRIIELAKANNKETVTFRTSQHESAVEWYLALGAEIIGVNGNDYEMEYRIGRD